MSLVNEDNRRKLYEFKYPVTKLLVMHEDCEVGNHYHKEKDEYFMLLSGGGIAEIDNVFYTMGHFQGFEIPRGTRHTFHLKAGSILLGFCTKEYDENDDYKS